MEIIDKETLAKEYFKNNPDWDLSVKTSLQLGIEIAENHYILKLKEEKENNAININLIEILQQENKELQNIITIFKQNQNKYLKELQEAKELLKAVKYQMKTEDFVHNSTLDKIEEFLKDKL